MTLKFFMSISRVTNFHRLISLFLRLLFSVIVVVIHLLHFTSIVLLFIYCILQDTPRTKRRASELIVVDSSYITNILSCNVLRIYRRRISVCRF